jgi:outer membrane protein
MRNSTRGALAIGLGLVGVVALIGQSVGQDAGVRQTSGAATAKTAAAPLAGASIGTIDMDYVLKNYDKFKYIIETENSEAMNRQNELMKIANEAKSEQEKLAKLAPGSLDEKKIQDRMTALKAQFEASREQAQAEFSRREIRALAEVYNDMQAMAAGVAKQRGMTYVMKYSSAPAKDSDPKTVEGALSRSLVYADARVDITADVTKWLNYRYKEAGGPQPKGLLQPAAGAASPAAAPATATQPAATQSR